jgi:hypothetical protein
VSPDVHPRPSPSPQLHHWQPLPAPLGLREYLCLQLAGGLGGPGGGGEEVLVNSRAPPKGACPHTTGAFEQCCCLQCTANCTTGPHASSSTK